MKTSQPLISIIVPVYNSQSTLHKCVESLIEQDYSNIEIVLVDDGSKDDSHFICSKYEGLDNRIRVITQNNSGVSIARNNGVNIARGEWVCFVDSDDYVDKSYISDFGLDIDNGESVLYLQGYQHNYEGKSEALFVHQRNGIFNLKTEVGPLFEDTDFVNQGTVCSKLYNRCIILDNHIVFNKKMRLNEDNCFFWEYVSRIEKIIVRDKCGYHYMHAEGINYSKSHKTYKEYLYIMNENKDKLNTLYSTFSTPRKNYYFKNYNQFVVNTWLHGLVALFLEPQIEKPEYEEVLSYSCELKNYNPKGLLLILLKHSLKLILALPSKIKFLCLKSFSKLIYKIGIFSI